MTHRLSIMDPIKLEMVGYGFFVLIIITGVVISIIASSCSENKNYSGYHGGDMRKFIGKK